MQTKGKLVAAAMATIMGVGVSATVIGATAQKMEKCYGVVKAGKNSCGNSRHACPGQAKKDGEPDEWVFLAEGTCEKLVGGSLESKKVVKEAPKEVPKEEKLCPCPKDEPVAESAKEES